ncbi:hypothetical protein Acr_00g0085160 [Actinidia rufa]|uniref:PGG domain-containing protein n=1 Tax=Actinidia rufa TaxID=165716 RepID=A0A7J0DVJ0_9ERIC|nr:hypothetical protein Acr_00g0085160 [Actinidia rufa]
MLGHAKFVKAVLSRKPELASELDSEGRSPLHLAAAKGHLEIARELLSADPEVCAVVRNSDGRTPLHAAAVKGRVEVVAELARVSTESTRALTDRGETSLHLCVRHNKFEVLKLLVEAVRKDGELVNWRDCEGNTILHIAVAKKQFEIIKFLLTTGVVEVNALNKNGSTSLDILIQSPRDLRDLEIEELLRTAGGKHTDWLGRKRSALMVVASLISTVAFQAGLTPPGGVWQDDYQVDSNGNPVDDPHTVGTAVMAYKDSIQYSTFMIFNTIAFLASLSIILLLVSGLPLKRRRWMWLQMVIMWITITALVMTYFVALRNMSPKEADVQNMLREVTTISVLTWLVLMVIVLVGNVVRMNLWILRKYGYIKEKESKPSEGIDEDQEEF